jgi:hypothetical protein
MNMRVLGLVTFENEPECVGVPPLRMCLNLDFVMDCSAFYQAATDSANPVLTVDSVVKSVTRVLLQAPDPFAIQNGDQLLLLDVDGGSWHFAELQFHSSDCSYSEIRRVQYESAREAIGALLSRSLSQGDMAMIDTVECLHEYLMRHYNIPIVNC